MKILFHYQKLAILIIIIFVWLQTAAEAKIYFVSKTAIGNENGSSWSDAFNIVQDSIDASAPGDPIFVSAGGSLPTLQNYFILYL